MVPWAWDQIFKKYSEKKVLSTELPGPAKWTKDWTGLDRVIAEAVNLVPAASLLCI